MKLHKFLSVDFNPVGPLADDVTENRVVSLLVAAKHLCPELDISFDAALKHTKKLFVLDTGKGLDACPVCGAKPQYDDAYTSTKYRAKCENCGLGGPHKDTIKEARDAWNNLGVVQ
jgi:hypothetical protein